MKRRCGGRCPTRPARSSPVPTGSTRFARGSATARRGPGCSASSRRRRSGQALDLARALGLAGARCQRLGTLLERRSRRGNFPGWGIGWLRLVTVLAGVAVIASIALGVQPFRHAILQASASLNGGGGSPRGSAGTEGNGTQASSASPTTATVAAGSGQAGQARHHRVREHRGTAPDRKHQMRVYRAPGRRPARSRARQARRRRLLAPRRAPRWLLAAGLKLGHAGAAGLPNSNAPTCPVAPPTGTPTPTPTSSSSSPDATPSDIAPTQESFTDRGGPDATADAD